MTLTLKTKNRRCFISNTITKRVYLKEDIEKYIQSGLTAQDLATLYGVSRQRIFQVLTKLGIPTLVRARKNYLRDQPPRVYWLNKMLCNKCIPKAQRTQLLKELVLPDVCPVLGIPLNYAGTGHMGFSRQENSPSIDRIDSSKGYEKDNMVIISWRANRIKNNGTAEEHKKIWEYYRDLTK